MSPATRQHVDKPAPMDRQGSRSRSSLSWTAQIFVNTLDLKPPKVSEPAYFKTEDGFVAVNAGLLKYEFKDIDQRFRARVSFHGQNVQRTVKDRIAQEMPTVDTTSASDRKVHWYRMLQIAKHARMERVVAITKELEAVGVTIDNDSLQVHRVSNAFSVNIDLETLRRMVEMRSLGFKELRHIKIDPI